MHFGDHGETKDFQGNIIPKNSKLIDCLGEFDELIAHLGIVRLICSENKDTIFLIQKQLTSYASVLANFPTTNHYFTSQQLDQEIDYLNQSIPYSNQFYIPGDREIPTFINIARTVARRTERSINRLDTPPQEILQFINRLSSYLFVLQMYYHHKK